MSRYERIKGQIGATYFDIKVNFRIVNITNTEIIFQLARNEQGVEIALCDAITPDCVNMNAAGICMNRKGQVGFTTDTSLSEAEKTWGTTKGGFGSSYMYRKVMWDYDQALPNDIHAVYRGTTRYFDSVGQGSTAASSIKPETPGCWLPSLVNILGVTTKVNPYLANYHQQFQYYAAGNRPFPYRSNNTSIDTYQWTSDPCVTTNPTTDFVFLSASYNIGNWSASRSIGIRPVFVI